MFNFAALGQQSLASNSLLAMSMAPALARTHFGDLDLSLGTHIQTHTGILSANDLQQSAATVSASGSGSAVQTPPPGPPRPSASECDFGFLIEFSANGLRRHKLSSKVAAIRIGAYEFTCEINVQQRKRNGDDADDKEEKKEKEKETEEEDKKVKDKEKEKEKAKLQQKPKEEAQHGNDNGHDHGLDDEQDKKQKEHKHEEKDKSERKHNDKDDDKHNNTDTNTKNENENEIELQNDSEEDSISGVVSELVLTSFGEDRWAAAKSELLYQNKLLLQLRSALANSQRELISMCENDATADLSSLGAMALEQQRLNAEIKNVESQTLIKYTAAERMKCYRLKPSQVCTIEDVCVMWSPPLCPFRSEQTKERSALSVSINSNGKELQFVQLPLDHPLKKIIPKFYWERSTHRGANLVLIDSTGATTYDVANNPFVNSTDITKAIHSDGNITQSCVSALPALSTTQISHWNLRVTRGTGFARIGYAAYQPWIGLGIQNKSMAKTIESNMERGTLVFGCPANGGAYQQSQVYTPIKTASFFSTPMQNNDVFHFSLDPVALKLTVSLNAEKDEAIFQLPSAGPYWIHAIMNYNGDGVELVPNE